MARPRRPEEPIYECCQTARDPYHVSPYTGRPVKRPYCRDDYERLVVWSTRQGFPAAENNDSEGRRVRLRFRRPDAVIARMA